MSTSKKIILAKPSDWDSWLSFVKARATGTRVWNLIDPELTVRPVSLLEPIAPFYIIPVNDADFNIATYNTYKARKDLYKTDLALFERETKALSDIISFIQDTITASNVAFIQLEEAHPWNYLRALKARLAPTDDARSLEIEQKYHKLCKGPGTQNLETWLDEWIANYTEARKHGILEVTSTRPIRDFLMAIRTKESSFSDAHRVNFRTKTAEDFLPLIEDFRQHIRLEQLFQPSKGESSHSAFSSSGNSNNASFRGQSTSSQAKPVKPCVCGDTHWLANCFYLVPEKRLVGWNPNPAKQKKVDDALKDNRTKAWVERSIQKRKAHEDKLASTPNSGTAAASASASTSTNNPVQNTPNPPAQPATPKDGGAFTAQSSFAATTFRLQGSWILDNGSDSHVCNSTMLSRFTKTRLAGPKDTLTSGAHKLPIECFGTVVITVRSPTGPMKMTLLNVAYISNFMTNLVSQHILSTKGVYFDN